MSFLFRHLDGPGLWWSSVCAPSLPLIGFPFNSSVPILSPPPSGILSPVVIRMPRACIDIINAWCPFHAAPPGVPQSPGDAYCCPTLHLHRCYFHLSYLPGVSALGMDFCHVRSTVYCGWTWLLPPLQSPMGTVVCRDSLVLCVCALVSSRPHQVGDIRRPDRWRADKTGLSGCLISQSWTARLHWAVLLSPVSSVAAYFSYPIIPEQFNAY